MAVKNAFNISERNKNTACYDLFMFLQLFPLLEVFPARAQQNKINFLLEKKGK